MSNLNKILAKKERTIIGMLSGTSVDAVDIVLIRFKEKGNSVKFNVLAYKEFRIPSEIKKYVLKVSRVETGRVDDVCRLNFLLGKFYSDCVNKFIRLCGIKNNDVDAIGSHGQTIHHIPLQERFGKILYKSTLQVGDPSVIANNTGIITVGDFRNADVGVLGGGAPLVPYLDFVLFRSSKNDRIVLNIGGISNLTYLPVNCSIENVTAFDTGPGNMMIDYLAKKYFNEEYDKNCMHSEKGNLNSKLFEYIIASDKYVLRKPPKSTGREHYSAEFIEKILKRFAKVGKEDVLRTFTEYTAYSIAINVKKFIKPQKRFELLVSGGGANNKLIMKSLQNYFADAKVMKVNNKGITASNKEAVLFALLAHETLNLNTANVRSVTGANKNVILGKICPV